MAMKDRGERRVDAATSFRGCFFSRVLLLEGASFRGCLLLNTRIKIHCSIVKRQRPMRRLTSCCDQIPQSNPFFSRRSN